MLPSRAPRCFSAVAIVPIASAAALLVGVVLAACGSDPGTHGDLDLGGGDSGISGTPIADGGGVAKLSDLLGDSGPISPGLGETDASYPALTPDMPSIVLNADGTVLSAPHVVSVFWQADANLSSLETFAADLGTSSYWSATTAEYSVGAATSEMYIIKTAPPTTVTDTAIDGMVSQGVAGGSWPVATPQTIYMVYVPKQTNITTTDSSGNVVDGCTQFAGYHTETNPESESKPHYSYGVIAEGCVDPTQPSAVASATETAAHEIIEAATDPLPDLSPGYLYFDSDHLSWELFQDEQDELADACEFYASAYYKESSQLPFYVQRSWSNASAAAGHNPCVPRVSGQPFYDVSLSGLETVQVRLADNSRMTSKGYRITPGHSKTIDFTFFSDAPTDGGWFLGAIEGNGLDEVTTSRLSLKVNTPQGVNGQTGSVTVTVNSSGTTTAQLVTLVSHRGDQPAHYMPVLIGSY